MLLATEILYWLSLATLAYIYAGYPLAVWLCARWATPRRKVFHAAPVSIVIVACNEAARLPAKLHSLLNSERSDQIAEILVGSDGSTDDTRSAIESVGDSRIRLVEFADRRGKPAVLNDLVPQACSEIVLLADARQAFHPAALGALIDNFADERVGVVSGELVFREAPGATAASRGIGFYWKYEKFIRKCESRFRGVPGATGACYALRKSLFRPIPPVTILDDVAIPMQAVLQGGRCVFEPLARVYDDASQSAAQESIRKRRTIAGAAQLIGLFPAWLIPPANPLWWEYVSHKLLRLASPACLMAVCVTNLALWSRPEYRVLLVLQAGCYIAAGIGWIYQRAERRTSLFGPFLMFVVMNWTTVLALCDALRNRYRVTWQRTNPETGLARAS